MPHLVYLTAGAAGMFCGSCMHDNALARAIIAAGKWTVTLVPTYTPIRTDEDNVSVDQVFFGGINVYLQQKLPLLRYLPGFLDRWLDQPWLIRRMTAKASDTSPQLLGELAVSMLKGRHGNQRKEVLRLLRWLKHEAKPDAIILTNVLIGGCIDDLRRELQVPVLATLQGDDAFLDILPEPYRTQATQLAGQVANRCDGILVHSEAYAQYMSRYLDVPRDKMHLMTLGIDTQPWDEMPARPSTERLVIGYLARLAPEKGLHHLIQAFIQLKQQAGFEHLELHVGGWLGEHRKLWFESHWEKIAQAGFASSVRYETDLDRIGKVKFLNQVDVLCVPTEHFEPKGLFALEAMAAGVPVVVPDQGAFSELIRNTGGGRLCRPVSPTFDPNSAPAGTTSQTLVQVLHDLLRNPQEIRELGANARQAVLARHNAACMANETTDLLERFRNGIAP